MLEIRSIVLFVALSLSCLLACSSENKGAPSTEVLLTIDSDLDDLASIEVRVQDMAGESEGSAYTFTLSERVKLPVSLTIVPSPGKAGSAFRVVARGLDQAGEPLLETKAYGRFVAGKRVALSLWLRAVCRGVLCPADQTCDAESEPGACMAIPTPGTRELAGGGAEGTEDVPVLMPPSDGDAGSSATPRDAGMGGGAVDAAADGAAGEVDAAPVVPHAENVPTLGAFSTLQEARRKGAQGAAASYLLFDDGFEVGETSCNGAGLCLTGSFAP